MRRDSKLIIGTIENRLTPPAPVSQTMGARLLRDLPLLACCSVLETTLLTWINFLVFILDFLNNIIVVCEVWTEVKTLLTKNKF